MNIKQQLLLLLTLCLFYLIPNTVHAQCKPTITGDTILCPNAGGTISTTQTYATYQWYKRSFSGSTASPVSGATQQQLNLTNADALNYFSVVVTQGACTDTSREVLIDQWAFLLPTVATVGEFQSNAGQTVVCEGDSAYFVMQMPYKQSITWFYNNSPISGTGANNDSILLKKTGNYTVEGAPSVCPNYIQPLGLTLNVLIVPTDTPQITQNGGQLEINNPSNWSSIQWFLNGNSISGATGPTYTPTANGVYTVQGINSNNCDALSNGFNYTISNIHPIPEQGLPFKIFPNPFQTTTTIQLHQTYEQIELRLFNAMGQEVAYQTQQNTAQLKLKGQQLPQGIYHFQLLLNQNNSFSGKIIVQ